MKGHWRPCQSLVMIYNRGRRAQAAGEGGEREGRGVALLGHVVAQKRAI